MKRIVYITGTRADFGLMSSVLREISKSNNLDLTIIVTGIHVLPEFGNTLNEIKKTNYKYEVIYAAPNKDKPGATPKFIGAFIDKLVDKLVKIKPDVLLLLGDRAEMLAGAIAGQYLNIPVAHVAGGDTSGHVDNAIRHAITKLSHIHFPSTKKSAQKIMLMNEDKKRIFVVGAPSLDNIKNKKLVKKEVIAKKYDLDMAFQYIIVIQHPVLNEIDKTENHIRSTLDAIVKLKVQSVLIHPNADAGGRLIIKVIKKYDQIPFIKSFKNIPYEDYLSLLKFSSAIVGNSSGGLIESPAFGTPSINIGTRQAGREKAGNVIEVGYDKHEIIKAIKKALYNKKFREKCKKCQSPYGNGTAGKKIAKILSRIRIDEVDNFKK